MCIAWARVDDVIARVQAASRIQQKKTFSLATTLTVYAPQTSVLAQNVAKLVLVPLIQFLKAAGEV